MSDGHDRIGDPASLEHQLSAHADALLDSLFADEPSVSVPEQTPNDSPPVSAVQATTNADDGAFTEHASPPPPRADTTPREAPEPTDQDLERPSLLLSPLAPPTTRAASFEDHATATPPVVNPSGPVRREPFARSPRAPNVSERRPTVVSRKRFEAEAEAADNPGVESSPPPRLARSPATPTTRARAVPRTEHWDHGRSAAQRAAFLEGEASWHPLGERRGNLLLISSELWTRAGDIDAALRTAKAASALLPHSVLPQQQLRRLYLCSGNARAALAALDAEIALAPANIAARLLGLRAALTRVLLDDDSEFLRSLASLAEVSPGDPRPALYHLLRQLADERGDGKALRLPEGLAGAQRALSNYRNPASVHASGATNDSSPSLRFDSSPSLRFERARRALLARDLGALLAALNELSTVAGLEPATQWLSAAVHDARDDDRSLAALRQIAASTQQRDDAGVHRALCRAALRANDAQTLRGALIGAPDGTFSAWERLTLAALGMASWEIPEKWLETLHCVPSHSAPLTPAAFALRSTLKLEPAVPETASGLCGLEAARALVAPKPLGATALQALSDSAGPLELMLDLEDQRVADNPSQVASSLLRWAEHTRWTSLAVLAAWLCESAGDSQRAQQICLQLLARDASQEAPLRLALALGAQPSAAAFESLADTSCAPRAALLLLEAAALADTPSDERLRLAERSQQLCPTWPFAYRLVRKLAAARGDDATLLRWLDKQRSALSEASSWLPFALQAALSLAPRDPARALQLLRDVTSVAPDDLSLQEFGERLDAANWPPFRERLAASTGSDFDRQRLLTQAALDAQHADLPAAVALCQRADRLAADTVLQPLLQHLADQLADAAHLQGLLENAEAHSAEGNGNSQAAREAWQRLAQVAGYANDAELRLMAWAQVLQLDPASKPAACALDQLALAEADPSALAQSSTRLALLLDAADAEAHTQLRLHSSAPSDEPYEHLLQRLLEAPEVPLPALLVQYARTRASGDRQQLLEVLLALGQYAEGPEDSAALSLQAAQLAWSLGDLSSAQGLLDDALEAVPEHIVALSAQAELCKQLQQWPAAAQALSAFAAVSHVDAHRADALRQAGSIWLDRLADAERGEAALEEAVHLGPEDDALEERLSQHYLATSQRVKLNELLERRIARAPRGPERERLQTLRAQTLEEIGGTPPPRPVSSPVDASPEHHDALEAYARQTASAGNWRAAEAAYLQLIRIGHEGDKQAEYYRGLAELYASEGQNFERAAVCFREVRKRLPKDVQAAERLIDLHERLEQGEEAIALQTELLRDARDEAERRRWTIRLAGLYASCAHDLEHAELSLQQARMTWPHDPQVLSALASLYRNSGQDAAFNLLLERASKEARNLLGSGQLGAASFELLRSVVQLQGDEDAAVAIGAARAALLGRAQQVHGVGPAAGSARVEKFLMPEALSPALRTLLDEIGPALDRVAAEDQADDVSEPLENLDSMLASQLADLARAFGLQQVQFQVSPALGLDAIAVAGDNQQVVFGKALLDLADRPLLTFFFYRALKTLQTHCCALLGNSAGNAQLRLSALLCALLPDWQPPGIDRSLMQPLADRIAQQLGGPPPADLLPLAHEVAHGFGARLAQVAPLLERWFSRSALLATGSPTLALRAVAATTLAQPDLPEDPSERLRFISSTALARDLTLFSVSDEYFAARRELMRSRTPA